MWTTWSLVFSDHVHSECYFDGKSSRFVLAAADKNIIYELCGVTSFDRRKYCFEWPGYDDIDSFSRTG